MILTPRVKLGSRVSVPDPKADDCWNHSFIGHVIQIKSKMAIVMDQADDCYSVDVDRLIVLA